MKKYQPFASTTALLTFLLLSGCAALPYSSPAQGQNLPTNSGRPLPEDVKHCGPPLPKNMKYPNDSKMQPYYTIDCLIVDPDAGNAIPTPNIGYL